MLTLGRKRRAEDPYSAKVPYLAGTIIGVREWRGKRGLKPITSPTGGFEWKSDGSATEAECRCDHDPPQPDCGCGLYAYHPWSIFGTDLLSRPSVGESVVGLVEAWGKIEVHRDGFRAQYAKPVAFVFKAGDRTNRWLGDPYASHLTELAERCDAKVIHADDPTAVPRWLEENGSELAKESVEKLVTPNFGKLRARLAKVNWPDLETVIAFPFQLVMVLFFGLLMFASVAVQFLWWGFIAYTLVAAITGFDPIGLQTETSPDPAHKSVPADRGWHPPMNR